MDGKKEGDSDNNNVDRWVTRYQYSLEVESYGGNNAFVKTTWELALCMAGGGNLE